MNKHFYSKLPTFSQFEDFTNHSHYHALPNDWIIFVTDIRNSTTAIENGLYKEVNLIGAASITLSIQALGDTDFPFVFGGDGASLCIPASQQDKVSEALAKLITLAKENFNLSLRVAKIPAADIYAQGKNILISKLEITKGRYIALFRGGGLAQADKMAKTFYENYEVAPAQESVESLEGLSCRWSPIPAKKGLIVSLLVMAKDESAVDIYKEVITQIRAILHNSIEEANPISVDHVQYSGFFKSLKEEFKFHNKILSLSLFKRALEAFFALLIFRYGITLKLFNAKKYTDSIGTHSDYRKFDDTLRLIIDCRKEEFLNLQKTLAAAHQAGKIYYGLFTSDKVLMTCFIQSTQQGEHLHFVDGGDGGLAMAAKQMKEQIKTALLL